MSNGGGSNNSTTGMGPSSGSGSNPFSPGYQPAQSFQPPQSSPSNWGQNLRQNPFSQQSGFGGFGQQMQQTNNAYNQLQNQMGPMQGGQMGFGGFGQALRNGFSTGSTGQNLGDLSRSMAPESAWGPGQMGGFAGMPQQGQAARQYAASLSNEPAMAMTQGPESLRNQMNQQMGPTPGVTQQGGFDPNQTIDFLRDYKPGGSLYDPRPTQYYDGTSLTPTQPPQGGQMGGWGAGGSQGWGPNNSVSPARQQFDQKRFDDVVGSNSAFSSAGQAEIQRQQQQQQMRQGLGSFGGSGGVLGQYGAQRRSDAISQLQQQGGNQAALQKLNQQELGSGYEGFKARNQRYMNEAEQRKASTGYSGSPFAQRRREAFAKMTPEQYAERQRVISTYDRS